MQKGVFIVFFQIWNTKARSVPTYVNRAELALIIFLVVLLLEKERGSN